MTKDACSTLASIVANSCPSPSTHSGVNMMNVKSCNDTFGSPIDAKQDIDSISLGQIQNSIFEVFTKVCNEIKM